MTRILESVNQRLLVHVICLPNGTISDKKSSYQRGTARRSKSVEILSTAVYWCHSVDRSRVISFLLVFHSNHVAVLHRSRDITSYTAYVTACDTIRWTILTCAQKLRSSQLNLPQGIFSNSEGHFNSAVLNLSKPYTSQQIARVSSDTFTHGLESVCGL